MHQLKVFMLVVCTCSLRVAMGSLSGLWDNDVYCGRHLDDIITPSTVASPQISGRSAMLALYEPRCEQEMEEATKTEDLPTNDVFVIAKYDTVTTPKHIWYNIDDIDDLKVRYQPKNCPEFLFFKEGSTVYEPEVYDGSSGESVKDWVWGKFQIEFTIVNLRDATINVEIRGHKPTEIRIESGRQNTFVTFISSAILVTDLDAGVFVYGTMVEPDVNRVVIRQSTAVAKDKETWYDERIQFIREQEQKRRIWLWDLATIYLRNFKQPVLLPNFTALAYQKNKIPEDLYKEIIQFYRDNEVNRSSEYHKAEPCINEREVKCSMVYFSDEIVQKIGATLKPYLEKWSGLELQLSRLYGVREYHRGNVLRDHVDRINTHVISAILQIDKQLDGQADWVLEVIGLDGQRKNVTLNPGEMLFYESAILIHGRPFPFEGRVFANAFLHYRPVTGWTWDTSEDGHWITHDGKNVEFLDSLVTENTKGRFSDEL